MTRKRLDDPRAITVSAKLRTAEVAPFKEAAAKAGMTPSAFLRKLALAAIAMQPADA